MDYAAALDRYSAFTFDDGVRQRTVYRRGQGPGVVFMHEMPGLHPLCIRFADRLVDAGMTVFMPSLFGQPGRPATAGYLIGELLKTICIRREFNIWATGRSSPIVEWLRALARMVHGECGGKGVGAVGMCITGGFALAMMTESAVVAPVMSQPTLPLGIGSKRAADIHASQAEIACAKHRLATEDLSMIGLRFLGDRGVPDARFDTYKQTFGDRFEAIEIDPRHAAPSSMGIHAVLTTNLVDEPGTPTKQAEERVIAFLRERTGA